MKIAIWGIRDGEYLYQQIKQNDTKYEVVGFCDNGNVEKKVLNNIPIMSIEELVEKYISGDIQGVIISVRKGYSRYCIIKQLKKHGIENIILLKPSPLTFKLPIIFDEDDPRYHLQWLNLNMCYKPIIQHLEINIADGCNLNCKGCLHFSNLYSRDEFPDLESLLKTIQEVAKKCEIFQFRVLGGEPLLNTNLAEFLIKLRKILPNTDLAVISNGILIPKVSDKLFRVMNENYIGFNLTLYKPTLKMKKNIYTTLEQNGVAYGSHEAITDKFEKYLMLEPAKIDEKPYEKCVSRGILFLKNNMLFRCPLEACIEKYYETFQIDLKAPEGIDVFDENINWEILVSELYEKPRKLCYYCSVKSEEYEWSNGKAEKEDWLISNIKGKEEL